MGWKLGDTSKMPDTQATLSFSNDGSAAGSATNTLVTLGGAKRQQNDTCEYFRDK